MASNQYVNKVVYGGDTLIDITGTTAVESDVASGKTFFKADGSQATGTASGGSSGGDVYQDGDGYLVLSDDPLEQITVESLSVTANGTYTAPTGKAYSPVTVNVSGGGPTPTPWVRPSDWPDLSQMDVSAGNILYMTSYADVIAIYITALRTEHTRCFVSRERTSPNSISVARPH